MAFPSNQFSMRRFDEDRLGDVGQLRHGRNSVGGARDVGDSLAQIVADAPMFVGSIADLGSVGIDPAVRCSKRSASGEPSRSAAHDRRAAVTVAPIAAVIRVTPAIAAAIGVAAVITATIGATTIATTIIDLIDVCGGSGWSERWS
jgi:hypothetical protein